MITFEHKLDNLVQEGSSFTEEEILFLKKEYENIKLNSCKSCDFFKKSLENKIEEVKSRCKSINTFSFSIKTKHQHYIYRTEEKKETLYDIASITKLFTLALVYRLEKEQILSYEEKVINTLPLNKEMKDVTLLDIIKMKGKIETVGKLSDVQDIEEFMNTLWTVHPVQTEDKGTYTDIGFTLLRFFIEKKVEKKLGYKKIYNDIMKEYLLKPLGLTHIMYKPCLEEYCLLGNGNSFGYCHDKKSRIIDSINGAAGLFTTIEDMDIFLEKILRYEIFLPSFIKEIFSYSFLDTNKRLRSYAGIYLPCPNTVLSYAASHYSNYSLAHQGYTGSTIVMDFKNHIINTILVDAIEEGYFKKGETFLMEFRCLQKWISLYSILFYMLYE